MYGDDKDVSHESRLNFTNDVPVIVSSRYWDSDPVGEQIVCFS